MYWYVMSSQLRSSGKIRGMERTIGMPFRVASNAIEYMYGAKEYLSLT